MANWMDYLSLTLSLCKRLKFGDSPWRIGTYFFQATFYFEVDTERTEVNPLSALFGIFYMIS